MLARGAGEFECGQERWANAQVGLAAVPAAVQTALILFGPCGCRAMADAVDVVVVIG